MFTAAGQALTEMFSPPFRAVLMKSIGLALLLIILALHLWLVLLSGKRCRTRLKWLGGCLALLAAPFFLLRYEGSQDGSGIPCFVPFWYPPTSSAAAIPASPPARRCRSRGRSSKA